MYTVPFERKWEKISLSYRSIYETIRPHRAVSTEMFILEYDIKMTESGVVKG